MFVCKIEPNKDQLADERCTCLVFPLKTAGFSYFYFQICFKSNVRRLTLEPDDGLCCEGFKRCIRFFKVQRFLFCCIAFYFLGSCWLTDFFSRTCMEEFYSHENPTLFFNFEFTTQFCFKSCIIMYMNLFLL